MWVLASALAAVLAAVLGHAALLRCLPKRFALPTLICCVISAPVALGLLLFLAGDPLSLADWLLVALLAGSLGLSYLFLFIGIAYDSPTLALVNAIADFGAAGMPIAELDAFIAQHPFVTTRLEALGRSGMLVLDGDRWVLRDRIGPLLHLGEAYRRLCTRQTNVG
jgi:hypothetical protein